MEASAGRAVGRLVALFIVVFGGVLLATLWAWQLARKQDDTIAAQEFAAAADEVRAVLSQRMLSYEAVLRSAAAFHAASEHVSRDEWREFTSGLRLEHSHPGLLGLGYAPAVPATALANHIARARAEGAAAYAVQPLSRERGHWYFPVYFLEPGNWRNSRRLGTDLAAEPVRAAALQAARDRAEPALSAPELILATADTPASLTVWLFWPLYPVSSNPVGGAGAIARLCVRRV